MHGIILVNKPLYDSSFKIVRRIKAIANTKKVGHGGTLDPMATGMLPIFLGESSKFARFILEADKCYTVRADIGTITTTGDIEGEVVSSNHAYDFSQADIEQHMQQFCGEISQVPPSYSALKHNGRPLYEYAREGINIVKPPRLVNIKEFELISWQKPILECRVVCSKGTYIRTLLADLGAALGPGGSLVSLHRDWVHPFEEGSMSSLEDLSALADVSTSAAYYTLDKIFASLPRLNLAAEMALDLCYGKINSIGFNSKNVDSNPNVALFCNDEFLGIATRINEQELGVTKLRSSIVKKLTKC